MANRVVMGSARGAIGLWVSKPGFDVLTTADENLLFSMGGRLTTVLASGSVSFAPNSAGSTINIPLATNGRTPMIDIRYAVKVGAGTETTPIVSAQAASGAWAAESALVSFNANTLTIVSQVSLNYAAVYFYTVFAEDI